MRIQYWHYESAERDGTAAFADDFSETPDWNEMAAYPQTVVLQAGVRTIKPLFY